MSECYFLKDRNQFFEFLASLSSSVSLPRRSELKSSPKGTPVSLRSLWGKSELLCPRTDRGNRTGVGRERTQCWGKLLHSE